MRYLDRAGSPFNLQKQAEILAELKRTQIIRGGKDILVTQTSSGLVIARHSLPLLIDDKYQLDMLFNSSTRVSRLCDRKEGELDDIWRVRAMHVQLGDKTDPFHKIMQALNIRGEFYVGWLTDAGVPGLELRAHDGTPLVAPRIARVGQWGDVFLLDPGDIIASTEDTDKVVLLNIWHDAHFWMAENKDGRIFFVTDPPPATVNLYDAQLWVKGDMRCDPDEANNAYSALKKESGQWRPCVPIMVIFGALVDRPVATAVYANTVWVDVATGNAAYSNGTAWVDLPWGTGGGITLDDVRAYLGAIDVSLIPATPGTYNLGSVDAYWLNAFLKFLNLTPTDVAPLLAGQITYNPTLKRITYGIPGNGGIDIMGVANLEDIGAINYAGYKLLANQKAPLDDPAKTEYLAPFAQFVPLYGFMDEEKEAGIAVPAPRVETAVVDLFYGSFLIYSGVTGIFPNIVYLGDAYRIIPDTINCSVTQKDNELVYIPTFVDSGIAASALSNWSIVGMTLENTDNWVLYGMLTFDLGKMIVELFKDAARTELVLFGSGIPGTIALDEENESGMLGQVDALSAPTGTFQLQILWTSTEAKEERYSTAYASVRLDDWDGDHYGAKAWFAGGIIDGFISTRTFYEYRSRENPKRWIKLPDLDSDFYAGVGGIIEDGDGNKYFCIGGGNWEDGKFWYWDGKGWTEIEGAIGEPTKRRWATSFSGITPLTGRQEMYIIGGCTSTSYDDVATTAYRIAWNDATSKFVFIEIQAPPFFGRSYLCSYVNEEFSYAVVGLGYRPECGGQLCDLYKFYLPTVAVEDGVWEQMIGFPGVPRSNARGVTAHTYTEVEGLPTITKTQSLIGTGDNLDMGVRFGDWYMEHLLTVHGIL
jgi:hypothetical protein